MKVYHGSTEIVENPAILHSSRTLDYGEGFYTTTSLEQAEKWVKNKLDKMKLPIGYVNIYEFDEAMMQSLKCLIFEEANEDWLDFVMNNRTVLGFEHDYDIVYGPVANDRVYMVL